MSLGRGGVRGPGARSSSRPGGPGRSGHGRAGLRAGAVDPWAPQGRETLEALCAAYWYPLYAYARRRGHGPERAQDLTQDFFAYDLEKARKRGGGRLAFPIDTSGAEGRYDRELVRDLNPERIFDRSWALTLL